jgi:RNA polymerase sigma-70 factor (ECF subfamily)
LDRRDVWLHIYRDTVEPLYGFVSRRTGGRRDLAEDVTQETYLRALSHWQNGGLPAEPLAWLHRVARNLLADHYRRAAHVSLTPERLTELLASDASESSDAAALIGRALPRLGARRAALLEAFYLDGKDTATIAAEMGISERAVEGRLRRARTALRGKLGGLA